MVSDIEWHNWDFDGMIQLQGFSCMTKMKERQKWQALGK
jgi:hypothetical protein